MDTRRRDIPWGDIKTEYVTTDASYSDLAKKYGVSKWLVQRHGREGWVEERKRYQAEKAAKIEEAVTAEAKEKGLAAIREIGDAAVASIPLIRAQIAGAGNGTQAEAAVSALRGLLLIVRDCYGLMTATEQARNEIDRAKLALEREKAKLDSDEGDGIVVSIDGAEEYAE